MLSLEEELYILLPMFPQIIEGKKEEGKEFNITNGTY
jgi:hypothetical protein